MSDSYQYLISHLNDPAKCARCGHPWCVYCGECDCPMDPYHRWNCALTPIWAQTIRDQDCNPWTVTDGVVHRFGLNLTAESFKRLGDALNRITEAERKAWNPAQPDTEPEDNE
jgi:hypothetical protein